MNNEFLCVHAYNGGFWVDFARKFATNRVRKRRVHTAYTAYMSIDKE